MYPKSKLWLCGLLLLVFSCSKKEEDEIVVNPYGTQVKEINVSIENLQQMEYCLYPYRKIKLNFTFADSTVINPILVFDGNYDAFESGKLSVEFDKEGHHYIWLYDSNYTYIKNYIIDIVDCEPQLYIPNTFVPTGDLINDTWSPKIYKPYGEPAFCSEYFEIRDYDHQLVYRSKSFNIPWNGYGWPTGIYYYYVKAVDWWGNKHEHNGKVFRAG